jgi:hypothetical protein
MTSYDRELRFGARHEGIETMNRIAKIATVALLATGLSVAAFAATKPDRKAFRSEQRQEFLERRLAKLPADEQRLARELLPLRDSLRMAVGAYQRKVRKDSVLPRQLTAERAAIADLEARIQRLRTENPEVWLDLLARMPGPGGPEFAKHPRRPGKDGPEPRFRHHASDVDGLEDLPPPPPAD